MRQHNSDGCTVKRISLFVRSMRFDADGADEINPCAVWVPLRCTTVYCLVRGAGGRAPPPAANMVAGAQGFLQ